MEYITNSKDITGYNVKIMEKESFSIVGYTKIITAKDKSNDIVSKFWQDTLKNQRLNTLISTSPESKMVFGLSSWDLECEKNGMRYTICVEEKTTTDTSSYETQEDFLRKTIGASKWLCFEIDNNILHNKFWEDDPYVMLRNLGYTFNNNGYDVGLHFEVYPFGFDPANNPKMEFWITVK